MKMNLIITVVFRRYASLMLTWPKTTRTASFIVDRKTLACYVNVTGLSFQLYSSTLRLVYYSMVHKSTPFS